MIFLRAISVSIVDNILRILYFWLVLLGGGFVVPALAQTDPVSEADSLLSYDLAEIVVSDGSVFEAETNTVQKVTIADINRENATTVSDLAWLIPAATIQTNSRGESLIYLRNAGERQVALFFNGALLNIPWDNRMNLDLVPANVIGGMTVTKGVPSVLYGTNVLGGAINITSRTIDYDGSVTEVNGQYGAHATTNLSFAQIHAKGAFKFTGAVGYSHRDGIALPPVALFSQDSGSLRNNTDREILNVFGQGSYTTAKGTQIGLSYLFIDGAFGIAPEGHINPIESGVRFWRYPKFTNSTLVLNASVPVGPSSILRGALWGSWFGQHINAYESDQYDNVVDQQQDEDNTFGTRITFNQQLGSGQLSIALNGLNSQHQERTLESDGAGQLIEDGAETELFEQFVYSAGAEYATPVSDNIRINLGGSLDGISTPKTGDKPARDGQTAFGLSGGLQYRLASNVLLRASTGRKVRFPTMRELFGVALNRFLLNPDLKPESSFVSEFALASNGETFSGEVIGFFQRTYDTIDQENMMVDGAVLRQRINLEGSRVFGVELVGSARPMSMLSVNGHLTIMKPRGLEGSNTFFLTEKPAVLGSLSFIYRRQAGLSLSSQVNYTGKAYGRNENNELETLVTSLVLDAKLSYVFSIGKGPVFGEVFIRVDNMFDQETLPQLGLPGAGRLTSIGISISL